ncbi:PH domain-containing protein [Candidatus Azambacteria bacterium]|nr:PH domain-containing protein [Candidatus Azambacteria bacterium]
MKLFSVFTNTQHGFEGKEADEKIIALFYRHWFVIFSTLAVFALLAIFPFAVYIFIQPWLISWDLTDFFIAAMLVYFIIWWNGLFYRITMYILDIWIVTDRRILDNEQHGFFHRTLSEMHSSKIQDISVEINGFIQSFLNYGSVKVQTAGRELKFIFKKVPDPAGLKRLLSEVYNARVAKHKNGGESA